MNNFIGNFIGFEGRVGRQTWWLSVIALIAVGIALNFILGAVMGTGMLMSPQELMRPETMQKLSLQGLISSIILAYPQMAVSVKRRHDRNNNGYDAIALIILSLLYSLGGAIGFVTAGGAVQMIFGLVFLVLGLWVFINLGFLKGTAGPNEYGADPLQG
jgi:uncharacterized membrane protein YhaH (DUF805 family)